jgi:OOP family OmpA-OmpF porin
MIYRKIITVVAASTLAAACSTWDVEPNMNALRGAESNGNAHQAALTDEYRQIAAFEYDRMQDWPDADRWAEKGLQTAAGNTVEPTHIEEWDLPEEHVTELAMARTQLVDVLNKGAATKAPAEVAKAQAKFDCWVEQQEENWQTAHIAACREQFMNAMQEVELAMAPPAPQPAPQPVPAEPTSLFELYFPFDSAQIGSEDQSAIQNAITVYREDSKFKGKDEVLISGHADRVGDQEYNLKLSKERAEAVRQQLLRNGIAADDITVLAFGESDPAVETGDDVKNAWNRRVEILVR